MRITFLSASGQLGGAETCLLDVLAALRASEPSWDLHVISGADGPLARRAGALIGEKVHVIPMPRALARLGDSGGEGDRLSLRALVSGVAFGTAAALKYVAMLRKALRALQPDVVHSNGCKMHCLALWAKPSQVPLVWHVHDFIGARPLTRRVLRHWSPKCSLAVANSKAVAEELMALCNRGLRVATLHNGIDIDRFTPEGPVLDLDLLSGMPPAPAGVVRVGLLATMARWKGHEIFLRAISLVPRDLAVRAYIIGGALYDTDGSQTSLERLRASAEKLGIAPVAGFTGFVEDTPAVLRALDIVVHASTQPEPFGLVIAEAMACGRAVIASRNAGAAELFTFGEDALQHPPGDSRALAREIASLAIDRERRTAIGKRARAIAELRFDRRRFAVELPALYRSLRGPEPAGSARIAPAGPNPLPEGPFLGEYSSR